MQQIEGQMSIFDFIKPDYRDYQDEIRRLSIENDFERSIQLQTCSCGHRPKQFFRSYNEHFVKCPHCEKRTKYYKKGYEAKQAWNNGLREKPVAAVCKYSGHECNFKELQRIAKENLKENCQSSCCRNCNELCGVRCNGATSRELLPCDNCAFDDKGCCSYETINNSCIRGDKQLECTEGWQGIYRHGNRYTGTFPECSTWKEIEIWSYSQEYDKYAHGFATAKDKTIKRRPGGDFGEVVAWRYK